MTDIVERLRGGITDGTQLRWMVTPIHQEAAAEITRLRAALAEAQRTAYRVPPGWKLVPEYAHPALSELATIVATGAAQIAELQRRLAAAPQPPGAE